MTPQDVPSQSNHHDQLRFLEEVSAASAGVSRLEMCIQCGTCGGSCPIAGDLDHTPRRLFAMIRAGMRDEVLQSNTPWMCVSCYHCVVRCPQNVHIPDLMYTLKAMAIKAGYFKSKAAPDFSRTFVGMIENYGRSFEFGLATRHYLRHFPLRLPNMLPISLELIRSKRIRIVPHRIKSMDQLKAILERASELELVDKPEEEEPAPVA